MRRAFICALTVIGCLSFGRAEDRAPFPWIDPNGIKGAVLISGSEPTDAVLRKAKDLTKEEECRQFIIKLNAPPLANIDLVPSLAVVGLPPNEISRDLLSTVVTQQPGHVAIGVGDGSALLVQGRQLNSLGTSSVTVVLAASAGRPLREIELKPGARHDLTMLRRAAQERALTEFPPKALPVPNVESGSLLIVGGGTMPTEITSKFIELAGGPDAPIVVLPIAAEGSLSEDTSADTRTWTRAGAKNVRSLRARDRAEVESDEFAAAINGAKGVWFNGGRQWRFMDAYMGTKAEELFRDVLRRGGVIGGSSAGASIQSQYMPRGSPLGNTDMMAEGYERGLGFLPGVAVDQHFTQRKRHADMTRLMLRWPQFLGIGLDESTAIVVQQSRAEVIGRGTAHFYDYRTGPPGGEHDFAPATTGQFYDLAKRAIVVTPN